MRKFVAAPILTVLLFLCSSWSASAENFNFSSSIDQQEIAPYTETAPLVHGTYVEDKAETGGCGIQSPLNRQGSTFYSKALIWCNYPFVKIEHNVIIQRNVMNFWVTVSAKSNSALATNKLETDISYRCDLGPGPHNIRVSATMNLTIYDGQKGSIEVFDQLANQACDW